MTFSITNILFGSKIKAIPVPIIDGSDPVKHVEFWSAIQSKRDESILVIC